MSNLLDLLLPKEDSPKPVTPEVAVTHEQAEGMDDMAAYAEANPEAVR